MSQCRELTQREVLEMRQRRDGSEVMPGSQQAASSSAGRPAPKQAPIAPKRRVRPAVSRPSWAATSSSGSSLTPPDSTARVGIGAT